MQKRLLSCSCIVLLLISILLCFSLPGMAASDPDNYIFDISEGNIEVWDDDGGLITVAYGDPQKTTVGFSATQGITIIGTSTANNIRVYARSVNITLNGVDIQNTSEGFCAFELIGGSNATLHLNGTNTLTGVSASSLVIEGTGSLTSTHNNAAGIYCGDTLEIRGGTVTATNQSSEAGIVAGHVNISGGTVIATGESGPGIHYYQDLNISGGTVTAKSIFIGAAIDGGGTVNISGGTVRASDSDSMGGIRGGDVKISGGTVTATGDGNGGGIFAGSVNISGGTVTVIGYSYGGIFTYGGTVNISGGTVTATSQSEGPGICGNIVKISGATVTASSNYSGVGISATGIIISGGTVTATGGAGIGGLDGAGCAITIQDSANVKAVNNFAAIWPAIHATNNTISGTAHVLMVNFAELQDPNIVTGIFSKTNPMLYIDYAPTQSYQSIAFTLPADTYHLKTRKYQQHGNAPDTSVDFNILSAAGLYPFDNVADAPIGNITYELNGGTNHPDNAATYIYGIGLTLKEASRDNYVFDGWYLDPNYASETKLSEITATDTGGKTLYAKWTARTYTITYELNGGTNHPDNAAAYTYGIGLTLKEASSDNYVFDGWYTDTNFASETKLSEITATDGGDKTLYAKWAARTYTIAYSLNGGTNHPDNAAAYTYGIGLTLKDPGRDIYIFAGWYDNQDFSGDAVSEISTTDSVDKTLYAKWEPVYTITPIANQTISTLTTGYTPGTQDNQQITIERTGSGDLSNLAVALSGSVANSFIITQPGKTKLDDSDPVTSFAIKAKDDLAAGSYIAIVTVTADKMLPVSFTVTLHVVNAPSGGSSSTPSGTLVSPSGSTFTQNGVTLTLPPGATENDIRITIKEISRSSGLNLPEGSQLLSSIFDIIKDKSGNFQKPVTITISFDSSKVDADKYDIAIYYYDEAAGKWAALDNIKVDTLFSKVSGDSIHFTKFAVIATPKEAKEEKLSETTSPQKNTVVPRDITTHWAKDIIARLIEADIVTGCPDGTFKPDKPITRAEFTVMLVKALKLQAKPGNTYTDTASHWAKDSIATASAYGIIAGLGQNTFGPDNPITREQAAVIISRSAKPEDSAGALKFTDIDQISPWARSGITAAVKAGFITGYPDGTLQPKKSITRAEAAVILAKLLP